MESGLKQRIIGALVLVVAAVIFLPMLLSGQDETERVQVQVPAEPVMEDADIAPAVPPTLPEPAPVPEIPEPGLPPLPTPAEPDEPEEQLAIITPTPAPAEPVAPTAPPASSAAPAGSWVVQQASFSSVENAERFRQTLSGQGYNAYTRSGQVDGKTIVRVYIGPLNTREAAARVRDELQRRHESKGLIVAYDEGTRAP